MKLHSSIERMTPARSGSTEGMIPTGSGSMEGMTAKRSMEGMTPTGSGSMEGMTAKRSMLRNSLLLLAVILAVPAMRAAAQSKADANEAQKKQSKRQAGLKPLAQTKAKLEAAQEGPEFLRRRQDWFFKPRAFPIGFIPQGARERALQQKKQMYSQQRQSSLFVAPQETAFLALATGPTSAWVSIGPQPTSSTGNPPFTSGRVTALAVNPNNANNVYLGGADGGLWVSTDGGNTWTALTDNPPNAANIPTVAVGAIALDPTTCAAAPSGICTTVYVGTGEDDFAGDNIYGEGVLKCTITAGAPPTAACTQDTTFHATSPLDASRGGPMVGALAVNRAAGQNSILLAGVRGRGSAVQSGVWCSADKGSTWKWILPTTLTNGVGDPGTDVAFASDGTAWVALGFPFGATANGIYKSSAPVTSCTITFTQQTLPVASASLGRITLALAPSDNTKIYAAIADATTTSSTLLGVLRSTNATSGTPTWTQLTDPLVSADSASNTSFCGGQCFFDMALAVDPANPAVVFAGGSGAHPIIRTINGTATTPTWADVTATAGMVPHVDTHAFAFASDGSKVWVGNDGGVWSTSTPGATISWNNLNGPAGTSTGALNLTQFYPGVSIHPSNPGFAIGGAQDNSIQVDQAWNPNNAPATALTWQDQDALLPCDGGFTVIDPTIPSTSYGECEYIANALLIIGVEFAGDGFIGNGFLATAGIDGSDRGSFIPPLVVDKSNSQTLYFGTCRVWQTKDGANTWNAISPDVTTSTHPTTCPVPTSATQPTAVLNTIAVAPSDSKTIYVGSDEGEVEVTSDGGANWASIVTTTLPARAVTQIAVDPTTPATAYAVFSGFGTCNNSVVMCDGKGHIFKTVNGTAGAATVWVDISHAPFSTTPLPDIPVNAIVMDPDDNSHNTLYAGTDIGAFFTTDGGVNWAALGAVDSMPNAQILSLTLHNPSRTLRAATHGRGMWDLNLGGQAAFGITSIAPFTANANAAAPPITNFTVNGNGFTASSAVKFTANGTPTSLAGSCAANTCTVTIPSAQLQNGALAQVTVTDPSQTSPTNAVPFTVLDPVPGITSISPTSTTVGTNGFVLTVNGSNFLSGANGTLVLFNTIPLPASAVTVQSPTVLTVAVPASNLTTAQVISVDTFNPQPGGGFDTNPTPPTLTVNAVSFTVSGGAVTVTTTAGTTGSTSSGTSTITLAPSPGAAVMITCPAGTPGLTCSPLTIAAGSTTGTLTVNMLNPSSATTAMVMPSERRFYAANLPKGGRGWWALSATTGLAAMVLLVLPGRKRYRAALGLGLVSVLSFTLGCGSNGGGGGAVATTTKITLNGAAKVPSTSDSFGFSIAVTGGTPNGQVQLLDGAATLGTAVQVSNGSASTTVNNLSVGTHSISAHYLGDTSTQASVSGTLNVTVTGTTTFAITASPAASNGSPPVNITIN